MFDAINIGRAVRASHANANATASRSMAVDAKRKLVDLEARVDRLTLVSSALWSLLKENTSMTEEDLIARVTQLDLSDGREDGKVRGSVRKCVQCGRTLAKRHRKCLYCGARSGSAAFDVAK